MLSNLFIFLVTLCDFKRTCICKPFESDARMQRWLQAYLHGVERRDFQVLSESCAVYGGGGGGRSFAIQTALPLALENWDR